MIPGHIKDELAKLSDAQRMKFQELCMWAANSGFQGSALPVDYGKILDMVKAMGHAPIEPVMPVVDDEPDFHFKDYIKFPPKG